MYQELVHREHILLDMEGTFYWGKPTHTGRPRSYPLREGKSRDQSLSCHRLYPSLRLLRAADLQIGNRVGARSRKIRRSYPRMRRKDYPAGRARSSRHTALLSEMVCLNMDRNSGSPDS